MADKIKIRRGLLADIPILDEGEFGLVTDRRTVYIGTESDGNILINPVIAASDGYSLDGYLYPAIDNIHGLGTPDKRWASVSVGPGSIHIISKDTDSGYSSNNEFKIGINPSSGVLEFVSNDSVVMSMSSEAGVSFSGSGSAQSISDLSEAIQTIRKDLDGYAFRSSVQSSLIPYADNTIDLGSSSFTYAAGNFKGDLWSRSGTGTLRNWSAWEANGSQGMILSSAGGSVSIFPITNRFGLAGDFALPNNYDILFSSTTLANGTADVGLTRNGFNNISITDGADGYGGLRIADGTLTDPSLSFGLGTGVGLYRPSANTLGFAANGATSNMVLGGRLQVTINGTLILQLTEANFASWSGATTMNWDGRSQISSPSNGNIRFTDNAGTSFTDIQLGGATSSYPAIRRSGAHLMILSADGSHQSEFMCFRIRDLNNSGGIDQGWLKIAVDRSILFSSTTGWLGTPDVGLVRDSSNIIRISDGGDGYGSIAVTDGQVLSPGLRFGSENTGLYKSASERINMSINGVQSFGFVNSGGLFPTMQFGTGSTVSLQHGIGNNDLVTYIGNSPRFVKNILGTIFYSQLVDGSGFTNQLLWGTSHSSKGDAGFGRLGPASLWVTDGNVNYGSLALETLDAYTGSTQSISIDSTSGVILGSDKLINWGSTTDISTGTPDVGFARSAAGVAKLTDGSSGAGSLQFGSRVIVSSPTDGEVLLTNAAGNDFTYLRLGGSTSAYPRIDRLGAGIRVYQGDGQAVSLVMCYEFTDQNNAGSLINGSLEFSGQEGLDRTITWSNSSLHSGTKDIGLARGGINILKVTAGIGGYGNLAAQALDAYHGSEQAINIQAANGITFGSNKSILWDNNNDVSIGTPDVGIKRRDPGMLEITNGSDGYGEVYSGGSRIIEGILSTTTGIDLSATTKQTLYVVPAGKTCYITRIIVRNPSAAIGAATATFGFSANADDVFSTGLPFTGLTGISKYILFTRPNGVVMEEGAAGAIFGIKTTVQEGEADTVTIDVFGYLI